MKLSRILMFGLAAILVLGLSGCGEPKGPRKESVEEYIETVRRYMEEKYSAAFQIVEYEVHNSSFSGADVNTIVLRDENGIVTNVRANYGTPYSFYDDYIDQCAGEKFLAQLDYNRDYIEALNVAVVVQNESIDSLDSIDISPENIALPTVIAKIPQKPNDENLKAIYEVYEAMGAMGYKDTYFMVGFVKESSDFDAAVENYRFHAKIHDSEYNGEFYAWLRVRDLGLSFEEFKLRLEESIMEES